MWTSLGPSRSCQESATVQVVILSHCKASGLTGWWPISFWIQPQYRSRLKKSWWSILGKLRSYLLLWRGIEFILYAGMTVYQRRTRSGKEWNLLGWKDPFFVNTCRSLSGYVVIICSYGKLISKLDLHVHNWSGREAILEIGNKRYKQGRLGQSGLPAGEHATDNSVLPQDWSEIIVLCIVGILIFHMNPWPYIAVSDRPEMVLLG